MGSASALHWVPELAAALLGPRVPPLPRSKVFEIYGGVRLYVSLITCGTASCVGLIHFACSIAVSKKSNLLGL